MSYVTTTKQLLGEDLSNLITSVTHFEKDSEEYLRLKEFAWRQILEKYHTSVTDDYVIKSVESFSEKFVFHGFDQKAKNLKTLISHYTNLDYFKLKADGTLKWGLIQLLIRLSYRPTDSLNDDPPVVIEDIIKTEEKDEDDHFDWGAYLKEGWEKFRLPSDDESVPFSDEEDDRRNFDLQEIPPIRPIAGPSSSSLKKTEAPKPKLSVKEWDNLCLENINSINQWIETQLDEIPWWKDSTFSENAPSRYPAANYCSIWLEAAKTKGIAVDDVRIILEYRIIQEVLFLLGTTNGSSTTLIDCKKGIYTLKPNIAISSLSPPMFKNFIETELCSVLPHIACLIEFQTRISAKKLVDNTVSDTYWAYSRALAGILTDFRMELVAVESHWKKKEGVITLRTIFHRLKPWFGSFEFLAFIHRKAIYEDFSSVEPWKCSMRLLSVLLQELKIISNSKYKKLALGLFLNSMTSYMRIIGRMMKGARSPDPKNEFVIYESYDKKILKIRRYAPTLSDLNISTIEFWTPFISSCFRSISSTHFLKQFQKRSTFSQLDIDVDVLMNDVIERIHNFLSLTFTLPEVKDTPHVLPAACVSDNDTIVYPQFSASYYQTKGCHIVSKVFEPMYKPHESLVGQRSSIDKLIKSLEDVDLASFPIGLFMSKMFTGVFTKYMEPMGFAYDALINEFKLLDHLRCLRKIFFLQILEPFVLLLFHKVTNKSHNSHDWTNVLRFSITDHYDMKTANQFQCLVSQVNLIDSENPRFVHEQLSFAKLTYQADSKLTGIITDSCIKAYNEIFKFFLQVKWAYYLITKKFNFRGVEESVENVLTFRRMYLLRMKLVNTMTTLRNYFFSMDEKAFDEKITRLCTEARDLSTIEQAHKDFLMDCKLQCFLNRKNQCRVFVDSLLVLCFKCVRAWWFRSRLNMYDVQSLEDEYARAMKNLITHLSRFEADFTGALRSRFLFLQYELMASSGAPRHKYV